MSQSTSLAVARQPRIPLHALPITLWSKADGFPIAANGLNLGAGGLSLHSSQLPGLGSQLQCEFRDPVTERDVCALTEVVWVQDQGPYQGEFGLRFLGLSNEELELIGYLLQEHRFDHLQQVTHASDQSDDAAES